MALFIEWNDEFSIGVDSIDRQHKTLINLTNNLYAAIIDEKNVAQQFKKTLSLCVAYVKIHFETEEIWMNKYSYPHYKEHKIQHETFIKSLLSFSNGSTSNQLERALSFAKFLREWYIEHIGVFDKKMGVYFQNKGINEEDIMYLSWNDSLNLGIDKFDDQHKKMIDFSNQLYVWCTKNISTLEKGFLEVFNDISQGFETHLKDEEEFLKIIRFPDYHNHKNDHDKIRVLIDENLKHFHSGSIYIPFEFIKKLMNSYINHIYNHDLLYAEFCEENSVALKKRGLI